LGVPIAIGITGYSLYIFCQPARKTGRDDVPIAIGTIPNTPTKIIKPIIIP
jgi:hypothetical protein